MEAVSAVWRKDSCWLASLLLVGNPKAVLRTLMPVVP